MIIRLVPRVGVPNYPIAENLGPVEICVEVLQGSLAPGQTATVQFATDNPTRKFFCVSQTFNDNCRFYNKRFWSS